MKYLILLISLSLNAQLQNDWNATFILQDMEKSWSVGNGCFEVNYKVVNVNDGLELNGNTLEVMDATIQVIGGKVTNFGNDIDILNTDLIIYHCQSSEIIEYQEILSVNETALNKVFIYPNPTTDFLNIKSISFYTYIVYDINGREHLKGKSNVIDVRGLSRGIYFLLTLHNSDKKIITKFIKI